MKKTNLSIKDSGVIIFGATQFNVRIPNPQKIAVAGFPFMLEVPNGTTVAKLSEYAGRLIDFTNRAKEASRWK